MQEKSTTFPFKKFFVTASLMALVDAFYARWAIAASGREFLQASFYAAILIFCSAHVTRAYVDDKTLIWAAVLGAFVGTLIAVAW